MTRNEVINLALGILNILAGNNEERKKFNRIIVIVTSCFLFLLMYLTV